MADPKSDRKATALARKQDANALFSSKDFSAALQVYSEVEAGIEASFFFFFLVVGF